MANILLDDNEIQQAIQYEDDDRGIVITDPVFYPKTNLRSKKIVQATAKKILLKLQTIYNLSDILDFNKKLGKFIQELNEEVK